MQLDAPASRVVAVDYGTKRVGLAIADPLRLFARPVGAFSQAAAVEEIEAIHADQGVDVIVVGWPLTPDGTTDAATERVQQYINRLQNALPGVRIVKRDERYTSEMAKDAIRRVAPSSGDKGRVDAAAAALILQDYLDASSGGTAPEGESG